MRTDATITTTATAAPTATATTIATTMDNNNDDNHSVNSGNIKNSNNITSTSATPIAHVVYLSPAPAPFAPTR